MPPWNDRHFKFSGKESLSHLENEVSVLLCLEEGVLVRDRVADDEALPAAHVLLPHRRELHLPRSVQDVQQARLQVYHGALLVRVLGISVIVRGVRNYAKV